MALLFVLCVVTAVLRAVGALGVDALDVETALRGGLAAMLLLTASAHVGSRRADLIRMVPPALPYPAALVTVTGALEFVGAVALLFPATADWAAAALAVLFVAMFPANVHAARAGVGIGGRPPTPLGPRTVIQVIFVAVAVAIAT